MTRYSLQEIILPRGIKRNKVADEATAAPKAPRKKRVAKAVSEAIPVVQHTVIEEQISPQMLEVLRANNAQMEHIKLLSHSMIAGYCNAKGWAGRDVNFDINTGVVIVS